MSTSIRLFSSVGSNVRNEIPLLCGAESTKLAGEGLLPRVGTHVVPQICDNISGVGTVGALVYLVAVCEASQGCSGSSPCSSLPVTLQPHPLL